MLYTICSTDSRTTRFNPRRPHDTATSFSHTTARLNKNATDQRRPAPTTIGETPAALTAVISLVADIATVDGTGGKQGRTGNRVEQRHRNGIRQEPQNTQRGQPFANGFHQHDADDHNADMKTNVTTKTLEKLGDDVTRDPTHASSCSNFSPFRELQCG